MKTFKQAVIEIARRRANMVLDPDSILYQDANFNDAAKVNRLAEIYGGTYTEAYSAVREEFRNQLKELA